MTEFNKVQQGRKDCTSSEKQLPFTTSADLNTFAPLLCSFLSASAFIHWQPKRRTQKETLILCFYLNVDRVRPPSVQMCHGALASPRCKYQPGLPLSDNSQLPNWLRLFSFAVINVLFVVDKLERCVISSGGGDFSPPSSHTLVSHLRWHLLLLSFLFLVIKKTSSDISETQPTLISGSDTQGEWQKWAGWHCCSDMDEHKSFIWMLSCQ